MSDPRTPDTISPPVPPTTANEVLRGLVAWLEGQPGGTTYPWVDPEDCLFARYSRSLGHQEHPYLRLRDGLGDIEFKVAVLRPHTYAAALQRAKALL